MIKKNIINFSIFFMITANLLAAGSSGSSSSAGSGEQSGSKKSGRLKTETLQIKKKEIYLDQQKELIKKLQLQ